MSMTTKRTPTDEQRRAVTTRAVSVVLSSGAGCGKTTVLTERYLSHLRDDGAEVGQVVAITFTDRAAREMRDRIRKEVTAYLKSATDAEADAWARHLRNLETAPISTIHAFCAALLRQYSIEAGLDPRFEVLEEVLSVNLEAEALDAGLQQLLAAQNEDLGQLVLLYGWSPMVEAVRLLVPAWDDGPWRTWHDLPAEEVVARWQAQVRGTLLPRYVPHLLKSKAAVARCLALLQRHPPQPGDMAARVALILEKTPQLGRAADIAAAIEDLYQAAQVGRIGAKAWPDADVYEQIKCALTDFRGELKKWDLPSLTQPGDNSEAIVATARRVVRVVGEVVRVYRERKRQYGVVDFQDLLLLARDLLRDHAEVRAQLRQRFRFLLIDELQDTDPVQMELIEHLCGDDLTCGKLFSVGDHNQSIYRFRGADVFLFTRLKGRVPEAGRQNLTLNYRSQPAILDFTNVLLQNHLTAYEPLRAHWPQVNAKECVEFLWSPRPDKSNVTEARSLEADWIARRIAAMVGRERIVLDRPGDKELRPVKAGDMVLLFRAMSNVYLYEAALRNHGIDYYLVGGRAFFAQQEIYDLLNLLRALENPQDAVSLAGTLRSPFCCVSDEALFVLTRDRRGLWAGLLDEALQPQLPADQRERVARARRHLTRWRSLKDRLPIARLLGTVFADAGYDAATQFESLADRKLANLWKLLDLARTFDRSGLFGLAEFIARLGDLVRTQPREEQAATQPENADVVRLMTIHQAKGLEFPVVIVPDVVAAVGGGAHPVARWNADLGCVVRPAADEEPPPFPAFAWNLWKCRNELEEWDEALRTLYVACTRARDCLILSGSLDPAKPPGTPWIGALAERFDLVTGNCLDASISTERRPRVRVYSRLEDFDLSPAEHAQRAKAVSKKTEHPAPEMPPPPPAITATSRRFVAIAELGRRRLPDESSSPAKESALRTALEAWDFRDVDALDELARRYGADAETLRTFAQSETCRDLAAACCRLWNLEFALNLGADLPVIQGAMDCVWQDADGNWHLLYFAPQTMSKGDGEDYWTHRQHEIILAATSVQRQSGSNPKTVEVYFPADGCAVRRMGHRLPYQGILDAVKVILANAHP
jgi:ATP-dependent helicase/nuclease subunit A